MPHTSAAKKHVRQSAKHRAENRIKMSRVRTQMKKVQQLLDKGDVAAASKEVSIAFKYIDKAAKTGVLHRNSASRKKSLLARHLKKGEGGKPA